MVDYRARKKGNGTFEGRRPRLPHFLPDSGLLTVGRTFQAIVDKPGCFIRLQVINGRHDHSCRKDCDAPSASLVLCLHVNMARKIKGDGAVEIAVM